MVEGIGDEVFHVLLVVLVLALGIVGWWSTSISEQPLIRTVLILEPRHRTAAENNPNVVSEPPEDTGQPDPAPSNNVHSEAVASSDASSDASKNLSQAQSEQQAETTRGSNPGSSSSVNPEGFGIPEASNELPSQAPFTSDETLPEASSGPNELRRRRLQFFEQGADSLTKECPEQSNNSESIVQNDSEATSSTSCSHETPEESETVSTNESSAAEPCITCDDIRIKLKFLNDNQKMVQGKLQEPLGDFKRRNFAVEMAARKVIRLIFNGQVLQSDDRTLQNYGLFDNCVVHCLVHNQRTISPNVESPANGSAGEEIPGGGAEAGEARDWDLTNVMYISMFIILPSIWYLRINFSQLFSATSTVALFGLSAIFVIFLVGMYIPDQEALRT